MRFKNVLGLLAIGGAVAYAQKKRGGELSFNGIKKSLRDLAGSVKSKLDGATGVTSGEASHVDTTATAGSPSVGSEYTSNGTSNYSNNGLDGKY